MALTLTLLAGPVADSKAADNNRVPLGILQSRRKGNTVYICSSTTCQPHLKSRELDYNTDRLVRSNKFLTRIIRLHTVYNNCHSLMAL